jgi:hypothetical protein
LSSTEENLLLNDETAQWSRKLESGGYFDFRILLFKLSYDFKSLSKQINKLTVQAR